MKRIELILIITCIISIILDFALVHRGFIMYSMLSLALFYLIFCFAVFNSIRFKSLFCKDSYNGIGTLKILGAIFTGIILFIEIFGILAFLIDLPFALASLFIGSLFLTIISIIGGVKYFQKKSNYYVQVLKRVLVFWLLNIVFVSIMPQSTWLNIKYRNYPEYLEVLKEKRNSPFDIELLKKEMALRDEIYKRK